MLRNYFFLLKKIFKILPAKYSSKLKWIFLALSISGILEAAGIGLLIPVITEVLDNKESVNFNFYYLDLFNFNKEEKIKYLTISIFCLYLIKAIYLTKLEFYIQKFSQLVKAELQIRLFERYTKRNYEFNINNNSSILLRNLTSEVSNFSSGLLEPAIMFAKELFIIFLILIMLISINFNISIFIIFFSILFLLIARQFTSHILKNLGKSEQSVKGKVNQIIIETLQGIKFIKSYNLEKIFNLKLNELLTKIVKIKSTSNTIKLLPRIWIEFVVIIFLIFLGGIFYFLNYSFVNYITFSSIFLISMLKIMPSLISAVRVINSLYNYKASIELVSSEFNENDEKFINEEFKIISNFDDINLFQIKDIYFNYKNSPEIFSDISFQIKTKGELVGIFGESGSGKTTLVDLLIGLLKQTKGKFFINDREIENSKLKNFFGYIPQNIFLLDDTIKNNILVTNRYSNQYIDEKFQESLRITQLQKFINSLENKENTLIGEHGARISGGQKQRIGIARALMAKPKVLIFDEATSGLDKVTESKLFEDLKKISKEISIIIISHNSEVLGHCNKIFELSDNKLRQTK